MGFASYREDDWESFLERSAVPLGGQPISTRHYCPFCPNEFGDRHALSDHLVREHYGHRPTLLIAGREPHRVSTIRQSFLASDVAFQNCSEVTLRINGGLRAAAAAEAAQGLLSQQRDAEIELDLVNRTHDAVSPVRQSYLIRIRIADKRSLDAVDRAFVEHLGTDTPHMGRVGSFLSDARCQGIAKDYADALGSYVRGLLVKDQALGTGVTLPANEADQLYGAALDALKGFSRPLSRVVCGLVRFSFNDFSRIELETGFRRLDRCNNAIASTLGFERSDDDLVEGPHRRAVSLCPIDHATDRVLDLSERLDRQKTWGPVLLEECQHASHAPTLTTRDRFKILALWAVAALRLRAKEAAVEPLRELRSTYPYGSWADTQLEQIGA